MSESSIPGTIWSKLESTFKFYIYKDPWAGAELLQEMDGGY